jgi:cell division protein FtsB
MLYISLSKHYPHCVSFLKKENEQLSLDIERYMSQIRTLQDKIENMTHERLDELQKQMKELSNKLDDVGKDLGKEQAFDPLRAPFPSSVPVFKDNIETLLRFFDFVSINQMKVSGVNCQPLAQKAPAASKKKLDSLNGRNNDLKAKLQSIKF